MPGNGYTDSAGSVENRRGYSVLCATKGDGVQCLARKSNSTSTYGEVMPQGKAGLRKGIATALERTAERLPGIVIEALREQWQRITERDKQIAEIERKLQSWLKSDQAAQAIAEIPGVGLTRRQRLWPRWGMPTPSSQAVSLRAWVGLAPKQTGTGGKTRLLGISKRGDTPTCERCSSTALARC